MKLENKENVVLFTEKYEGSGGIIGKKLIENFFKAVATLIPDNVTHAAEIGCGPGYSTNYIHTARPDISLWASDIDPDLVALTHKRLPNITTSVESIYNLQKESGIVDCVFTLEVLEHLEKPFYALKEIHRVTRQYAIISVPREPLWRILNIVRGSYLPHLGNTPGHINHWSTQTIQDFVSPLFTVEKVRTPIPWTVLLLSKK